MRQRRVAEKMDQTVKKGLRATQIAVRKLAKSVPKREISLVNSIKGLSGEKHFFEESISVKDVKTLLDDKTGHAGDSQKIEGLKWLLAQISKANDVSQFFPDVVKLTARKNFELKRFVYMYLTHYADFNAVCRNLAVLSVNQFLNDMKNPNELIRALALRVLASLRVPDIVQIQLFELRKMINDASSYVRKTVAHAVPKLFQLDNKLKPDLIAMIDSLLGDNHTNVLGSAIAAFTEVCPQHYELLHPHYRKLCNKLADMDEWGQIAAMNVLSRYARAFFTAPPKRDAATDALLWSSGVDRSSSISESATSPTSTTNFYGAGSDDDSDDEDKQTAKDAAAVSDGVADLSIGESGTTEYEMHDDHRLLISKALQLLRSRNSGVVMTVCSLYYYLGSGSPTVLIDMASVLARFLCASREVQFVLMKSILRFAARWPSMFKGHLELFIVCPGDPEGTKIMKIQALMLILDEHNAERIIKELQRIVRGFHMGVAVRAIQGLCTVGARFPLYIGGCLNGLMALLALRTHQDIMYAAASGVHVLLRASTKHSRTLDAVQKAAHESNVVKVVKTLSRMLKHVTLPRAREHILRILYEYEHYLETKLDLLRLLLKGFVDEAAEVKLQIVELAVKLTINHTGKGKMFDISLKLLRYALDLSKRDPDNHVRDRARFLDNIILSGPLTLRAGAVEKYRVIIANRFTTLIDSAGIEERELKADTLNLGSMSFQIGKIIPGYVGIPDFASKPTDPSLRDEIGSLDQQKDDNSSSGGSSSSGDSQSSSDDDSNSTSGSDSDTDDSSKEAPAKPSEETLVKLSESDDSSSSSEDDAPAPAPPAPVDDVFDGLFDNPASTNPAPTDTAKPASNSKSKKAKKKAKAESSSSSSSESSGSSSDSSEDESDVKAPAPAPAPASKKSDLFDVFNSIEKTQTTTSAPAPAPSGVDPMSLFDDINAASTNEVSKKKSPANDISDLFAGDGGGVAATDLFAGDGGGLAPTIGAPVSQTTDDLLSTDASYSGSLPKSSSDLLDVSYGDQTDLTDDYGGPLGS